MTAFREDFLAEAIPDLLEEFGEPVTYLGPGAPREITAIVEREPLQGYGSDGVAPLAVMRVSPDPDLETHSGIDPDEKFVGWGVRYAQDIDGLESIHKIDTRLPNQGGFVMFEVR